MQKRFNDLRTAHDFLSSYLHQLQFNMRFTLSSPVHLRCGSIGTYNESFLFK